MKMSCPYSMTVNTNNGVCEPANPSYNLKKKSRRTQGDDVIAVKADNHS